MHKKTKIVATIGPATESEETLEALMNAGMNVARFNTKHNEPAWHTERMARVKRVAERLDMAVAVLVDLQGPEIRTDLPAGRDSFQVQVGDTVTFTSDAPTAEQDPHGVIIPQIVIDALQVGNVISIEDGIGEFEVVEKRANAVVTKTLEAFTVKKRKTLNTPKVDIPMPSLIPNDYLFLDAATTGLVDYVALSFVRNKQDIEQLREELKKRNVQCGIVAKIENQAAINNLDEIIAAADAVMVARGDLGVEVPYQELARWQKVIIQKSREMSKPVITATQMLKSMVESPRPTRAEVCDVSNAVYDGTDAVMLSEETTIGKFPVKAVETQANIANYTEQFATPPTIAVQDIDPSTAVTHAATNLIAASNNPKHPLQIAAVVCLTETGTTARYLSRFRKVPPIHALTASAETYRRLSLVYGVQPHKVEFSDLDLQQTEIVNKIKALGIAQSGETILLIQGVHWRDAGMTNTLKVLQII